MSTLAETYALSCGVALGRAQILDTFFPLDHPIEKTILIHAFAGKIKEEGGQRIAEFPAKIYDYYDEVVALLKPIVEAAGYKIFQIGGPGEPALKTVESLAGKTTVNQCAYLVKNCALLIANDSLWAHVRGHERKPLVAVYGATSNPHFPYEYDPAITFLIESHRSGKKPSYSSQESPKTINFIKPEDIVIKSLAVLGLDSPMRRQSIYINEIYLQPMIELVPSVVVDPRIAVPGPLILRMDYLHDEPKMVANLQIRKCAIVTSAEIDLQLLAQLKPNITAVKIEVNKISAEWLKGFKRLGIPATYYAIEPDPDKLAALRLALYDACLFDLFQDPTCEDFLKGVETYLNKPLDKSVKLDTLRFKSNKFLFADDKIYLSKAHWLAGRNTPNTGQNTDTVIDSADFWMDAPHYYFYIP